MKYLLIIILPIILISSQRPEFKWVNGLTFWGGLPFSGTRVKMNGGTKKVIQFKNGLRHGKEFHYYPSGKLKKDLTYEEGKVQGIH